MGVAGPGPTSGWDTPGALVGRDIELEQLGRLVDRVGTSGGALVVRGEAGIGKSALLQQCRASPHSRCIRGHDDRDSVGGAAGLRWPAPAAAALLGEAGELPKPQRQALDIAFGVVDGDAPDVFLIGLATLGALTEGASRTPWVLVVEDAHWLDRSSSEVLAFVGRRLEMEGVLMLFAVRDGEPSAFDDAGLPELRVSSLDDSASRALLAVNGAGLPAVLQERILAEAAGNPLALIELPIAADGPGRRFGAEPLPLTARLEAAFASKLDGLDGDEQTLLLLAALDDGDLAALSRAARGSPRRTGVPGALDGGCRVRAGDHRGSQVQVPTPVDEICRAPERHRRQRRRAHAGARPEPR